MTPDQRIESFLDTFAAYVVNCLEDYKGPHGEPPQYHGVKLNRSSIRAAISVLLMPVCGEKDCESTGYLSRCHACSLLMCPTHLIHGTGVDPDHTTDLCLACAPGPEPQEW